ncbi:MAG: hypothetical protein WCS30_00225 [Selenomonadaceae bacterium]
MKQRSLKGRIQIDLPAPIDETVYLARYNGSTMRWTVMDYKMVGYLYQGDGEDYYILDNHETDDRQLCHISLLGILLFVVEESAMREAAERNGEIDRFNEQIKKRFSTPTREL